VQGIPRITQLIELPAKQKGSNMFMIMNENKCIRSTLTKTSMKNSEKDTFIFAKSLEELYISDMFIPNIDIQDDFISNKPRTDKWYEYVKKSGIIDEETQNTISSFREYTLQKKEKSSDNGEKSKKEKSSCYKDEKETEVYTWSLRLRFNYNKLCLYDQELWKISRAIEGTINDLSISDNHVVCVFSTNEDRIIDVYINPSDLQDVKEISKKIKNKKFQDIEFLQKNFELFYIHDVIYPIICDIKMGGIVGISKTFVNGNVITTEGNNIQEVLTKIRPDGEMYVDHKSILSTNVWDIYNTFGIEATRQYLVNELDKAFSFGGGGLHKCHIELLVDAMTFNGVPTPVNRYGSAAKAGILTKASFEEQTKNFRRGAIRNCTDDVTKSVSASCITGNPRLGGKSFDLIVDTKMLDKYKI
jgi:hypothetical protein